MKNILIYVFPNCASYTPPGEMPSVFPSINMSARESTKQGTVETFLSCFYDFFTNILYLKTTSLRSYRKAQYQNIAKYTQQKQTKNNEKYKKTEKSNGKTAKRNEKQQEKSEKQIIISAGFFPVPAVHPNTSRIIFRPGALQRNLSTTKGRHT